MASVRLKPGSLNFFACYKVPTGRNDAKGNPIYRRLQRSTGTKDKTRAEQLAISYERVAILAGQKRLTENAAHKFLAEIKAITGVEIGEVEPTDAYLARWFAGRMSSWSQHTRERYQLALDEFLDWLGPRRAAPLSESNARTMTLFRDAETKAGKSAATVNKTLGILGQAFAEAVTQNLFQQNPARGLNVKGAKRQRQRRRPFTFAQFSELVAATTGEWRTFVLIGGYTGGRQQECAKLTWPQIDFTRHRLFLDRSKTSDQHAMPMHAALEQHLHALWRADGEPKSGPVLARLSTRQRRALSNHFRRAILPLIGITQAYGGREGAGRKLAEYSFHSFRHSLSTWLQAAGVDEMMRMRLIGHEDESVSRGYTHTGLTEAATELAKVPSVATL